MHKTLHCLNETLSGDGLLPYQVIYKAMAPYWHLTSNLFNIAHISKDVKSTCMSYVMMCKADATFCYSSMPRLQIRR